ncbi:MAG: glutamate 5-kinase [Candidatus Binatus sp.]|uniref:glutamate 5-kinase n=1 Tax=Candidatus Binatus sp. TaxID=2811406 RepID=UPI002717347C|nr:glutamate 5-kinase [Candidatus Binatus sp.]MDO8433022.1 glutamate 5-kinase [Candidatus Binatus sp.]
MSQLNYKESAVGRARRIVIKVGSAVLSDQSGLRADVIEQLAAQVDTAVRGGREVLIVTSGAVAAGRARLAKLNRTTIAARQAAAATGQIDLMSAWARAFGAHGRSVAQILLTHQDLAEKRRRTNASQTISELFEAGVIPIVNENDTVAVDEIRLGDNDVLSSLVASLVQAQLLIILSDVDGVLTGDPRERSDARLIPVISDPDSEMRGLVAESAESAGPLGVGGMATKLKAARQAARAGIAVIIARGRGDGTINKAIDPASEIGTLIVPAGSRLKRRKSWIAFALRPSGALGVDRGAAEALQSKGRSLLPSGVREIRGDFGGGDCVSLIDPDGIEFGRGLVNYPAADVVKVAGRRSSEISQLLGYKVADEIIHRDNFVLMKELA